MQDGGFNSFASNVIKLSVNETNWSSLLARSRAFRFGPEKLPGLSRNGPQGRGHGLVLSEAADWALLLVTLH